MSNIEKSGNKVPKKYDKTKKKYSKQEKDFLTQYAITNNKFKAMELSGLNVNKKTGELYSRDRIMNKAWLLLSTPFAQEYVANMHKEILKKNCFTLERAINESYDNYQMLKDKQSFHAMNEMYNTHLQIAGLLKPGGVNVQTQIVAGENGLTINYIQPKKEDDNDAKV